MDDVTWFGLAAVPTTAALVEVIGRALPSCPRRMLPLVAIVLGVSGAGVASIELGMSFAEWVFGGIGVGLAATGTYENVTKATTGMRDGRSGD